MHTASLDQDAPYFGYTSPKMVSWGTLNDIYFYLVLIFLDRLYALPISGLCHDPCHWFLYPTIKISSAMPNTLMFQYLITF